MAVERLRRTPVVVGLVVLLVTALTVIQVRSQEQVAASLAGQDNTSLAFLIDDLHKSNDQLAAEDLTLTGQRDALRAGGGAAADAALQAEARRLRVVEGLTPVTGPGVSISIDAPLNQVDLQDAVNNLRRAGAEAVEVAGQRVVMGSVIDGTDAGISINGVRVHGNPWQLEAIGNPDTLSAAADEMTRTLRSDPRVLASSYQVSSSLNLAAILTPRPFVYALPA